MLNKAGFIVIFLSIGVIFGSAAESLEERLGGEDKLAYGVYFNGVPAGEINWQYLGSKTIDGVKVDVLRLSADTTIMNLLNLESDEKVFLDSTTYLPFKVERNVTFFGKKELIEEIYHQDKGYVEVTFRNAKVEQKIIHQDKPIHNILALLYFFPDNIRLVPGKWIGFNLPTYKIKIKYVKTRVLKTPEGRKETYFLLGRGAKRFSLWLDKDNKLPLRLEFITLAGKIIISRK